MVEAGRSRQQGDAMVRGIAAQEAHEVTEPVGDAEAEHVAEELHRRLMVGIDLVALVGFAVLEVNAEMSVKVVGGNGGSTVRHAVHGGSVDVAVVENQDGTPAPAPFAPVDALHGGGVLGSAGLGINMIVAGPADDLKGLAGFYVLNGKTGILGNYVGHFVLKPVQHLGFVGLGAGGGRGGAH